MATKKQKSPEPKEALDDIEEMIVCYLCESRAVPDQLRWYRCIQLHLVCQSCKSEYTIPICKCGGRILETPCGIINAILKNARKRSQCAHAYLGCQEIPDHQNKVQHELECIFRLVPCPFQACNCQATIKFKDVMEHYLHHRSFVRIDGMIGTIFPMESIEMEDGKGVKRYQLDEHQFNFSR